VPPPGEGVPLKAQTLRLMAAASITEDERRLLVQEWIETTRAANRRFIDRIEVKPGRGRGVRVPISERKLSKLAFAAA
jgi:hypothetical protein